MHNNRQISTGKANFMYQIITSARLKPQIPLLQSSALYTQTFPTIIQANSNIIAKKDSELSTHLQPARLLCHVSKFFAASQSISKLPSSAPQYTLSHTTNGLSQPVPLATITVTQAAITKKAQIAPSFNTRSDRGELSKLLRILAATRSLAFLTAYRLSE